ncbi:MAG: energy-coupling factor transporter ATPase [Candidatus Latescibacterota bacterium]|jgi:energy-coupling factor transporter ATPase
MISIQNLSFHYSENRPALQNIDLEIHPGESVAIIGANGSGKTTLARCLNGLHIPSAGRVLIDGMDTRDSANLGSIRRQIGMVFQNPDDQLISTTVEGELAFGLENLALPRSEMTQRIDQALHDFDLIPYRNAPPHRLSGGEKQRLAIAAASAMRPHYLVLDEPTALLDPQHRQQVGDLLHSLSQRFGIATILITQLPDEAVRAGRVIALNAGQILLQGTPQEAFSDIQRLREAGLGAPFFRELSQHLSSKKAALNLDELIAYCPNPSIREDAQLIEPLEVSTQPKLVAEQVSHTYDLDLPTKRQSLRDINITFATGCIHALVGTSGSGKTTLAQHLNALLKPHRGRVLLDACDIWSRDLLWTRQRVGLVFQFPELQLFAETVEEDVAFGPRNLGYDEPRVQDLVSRALDWVGLERQDFGSRTPLSLSGGERRRAALAGVLAMDPDVLVLDEPTAGLDPRSTHSMRQLFAQLAADGKALVLITHDMDLVAQLAHHVTALRHGEIVIQGSARTVLTNKDFTYQTGLAPPTAVQLAARLDQHGLTLPYIPLTLDECKKMFKI